MHGVHSFISQPKRVELFGFTKKVTYFYIFTQNYAEMPAYSMDVMCVRNDDILCVTLPFYNFGKCVSKFTFYPLQASSNIACECQV
jgi:hypothetical protein